MPHEPLFIVTSRTAARDWLDSHADDDGASGLRSQLVGALDLAQAESDAGRPATIELIVVSDADFIARAKLQA